MRSEEIRCRLPGVLLTLIGAVLMVHTFSDQYASTLIGLQYGPVFFPRLLLGGWLILSVLATIIIPTPLREAVNEEYHHVRPLLLAGLLLLFILALKPLGFLVDSFLLCLFAQWIVAGRLSAPPLLWSAILAGSGWACFEFAIGIPLPQATWF